MTEKELNIVGHSLGIDVFSLKRTRLPERILLPDEFYRNYYAIGKSNPTKAVLENLMLDDYLSIMEVVNPLFNKINL